MKRFFFMLLAVVITSFAAKAQSFFELDYLDKQDGVKYLGLMTYFDEENATLRCVQEDDIDQCFECDYTFEFNDKKSVKYMVFAPTDKSGAYPIFVWTWKKKDQSDISEVPYVVFDRKNITNLNKATKAEYFEELSVSDMDEEYIGQFYGTDEEMYKTIVKACKQVRDQDKDIADYDVSNTKNVSNGTATMHFVMVAATKDPTIGTSVETDLNLVEPEFSKIAKQLKIGYDERIVKGSDFSKSSLEKAISNMQVGKNDIIVFVYSGHGFRFDDTSVEEDAYPNMYLTYSDGELSADDYAGVSEVYNFLVKKGARLTIVLSDCCNSKVGVNRIEVGSTALAARGSNNYDVNKLKKLFLESSGSMKVTAAKAGQYALCDDQGGYLLTSFLNNLHNQISATSNKAPSWTAIIEGASKFVKRKTSEGFDETGENRSPQIVVRSVNIKQADGSSVSADSDDTMADGLASADGDSDDEDDAVVDFLCVAIPLVAILILIIVIIKLKKKKQNQSN